MSLRILAAGLVLLAACSHSQPSSPPVADVVAQPTPPALAPPEPEPVAPPVARPPDIARASVYFDYDSSELDPATRAALQAFFDQAQQRPDQNVRIEGNCDERGTREYNLALGQRRADAAKKYLTDLGLDPARIATISYGKERPRVAGDDEDAWRENRRDDLIPGDVGSSNAVSQASR